MIGTEPSPEGTSRQTVNGLLHEAGTTGGPLEGSGRLPNRGQRRDSLRREAGLSAAPRLAGDGRSKIHVRGHAARVAPLLPTPRSSLAQLPSAASRLELRQATR